MLDLIDFVFRLLGLDRSVTAGQAGSVSQIFAQIERQLSIPYIGYHYLLILVGLALCLWGRQLYWLTVFLYGALIGAIVGIIFSGGIAGGGVMFALVGGVLAVILQYVFNFVIGGLIGGILLVITIPNPIAFLLGFVIGGVIAVNFFRYLVIVLSALKGATLVGSSVKALMEPVPSLQPFRDIRDMFAAAQHFLNNGALPAASGPSGVLGLQPSSWGLICAVICFVGGVWYQLRPSSRSQQGAFAEGFATELDDLIEPEAPEASGVATEFEPRPSAPAQALLENAPEIVKSIPELNPHRAKAAEGQVVFSGPWQRAKPQSVAQLPKIEKKRDIASVTPIRPPPPSLDDAPVEKPAQSASKAARAKSASHNGDGKQEGTGVVIATAAMIGLTILVVLVLQKQKHQTAMAPDRQDDAQGAVAVIAGESRSWPATLERAASLPVPAGRCALIIASRQSITDARRVIEEYGAAHTGAIYLAQNGWYAVSAGLLPQNEASDLISSLKSRGTIPNDSLCSAGRSYQSRVWP